MPATKVKLFDNILNFRDVGKTINGFLGTKHVVEGRIYRSARPDDATMSDRRKLKEEYNINTIMDLRTVTEHANQAKKRASDLQVPALVQSNDALAKPVQIPGMNYIEVNVNGKGFERTLMWQLSYWNITKLVSLMAIGRRMKAINVLGKNVMQPRGLIGLGYDSLDACGPEIAEALRAFCHTQNFGILVHCTQGKDRTGLIIAIILFLLEVPIEAMTKDYVMSEGELLPECESRLVEIRSIGLSDDFAGCPKDWIIRIDEYLREKYGSAKSYCTKIGFTEKEQAELIALLGV
ncbi:tyrosine/serine protein phosphatase-like protein [Calycina marina]|uniref:Tyrosine/serine protein phosphatase-like protein n=1 Tax=Calycina marina TaxID=1763456 RepID=A0A9P8CCD7_9HELO|nr:tyrosine/serine protein phosphatase-like protein [Calycina marina]